jgi:predicted esterase
MDTDPLNAALKVPYSQSVYVVADIPIGGYVGGATYATALMVQQLGLIGNLILKQAANPDFMTKNLAGET